MKGFILSGIFARQDKTLNGTIEIQSVLFCFAESLRGDLLASLRGRGSSYFLNKIPSPMMK